MEQAEADALGGPDGCVRTSRMAVVTERFLLLSAAISGIVLGAARLIQAVFGAAVIPVAQGYMADFTERSRRVRGMGALSAAISFGTLSGSVLL